MTVVRLNGTDRDLPDGAALADAVAAVTDAATGIAAAVDGSVVPRSQWATTTLAHGAHVEVLTAVQGG